MRFSLGDSKGKPSFSPRGGGEAQDLKSKRPTLYSSEVRVFKTNLLGLTRSDTLVLEREKKGTTG